MLSLKEQRGPERRRTGFTVDGPKNVTLYAWSTAIKCSFMVWVQLRTSLIALNNVMYSPESIHKDNHT